MLHIGLLELKSLEQEAKARGKTLEEVQPFFRRERHVGSNN